MATLEEESLLEEVKSELNPTTEDQNKNSTGFGYRHILAIIGFFGFANIYAMRVNLSVAIVAMVNSSAIPEKNHSSSDVCPVAETNKTSTLTDGPFAWDEYDQGLILGSFFWGYMITNFIGGRLAEIYGGKTVYFLGVVITSLLSLLTPVAAFFSFKTVIVLRVLMGLAEGVSFPSMNHMLSQWVPPLERSQISSLTFSGASFGTVVCLPISGFLCQSTILGGWPSVFYLFGALGFIWSMIWLLFIYESPSLHPYISEQEKQYISSSLKSTVVQKALPLPIRQILTSMPFWAIFIVHICQNWGFYFLLTELPTYLHNMLHFNIQKNSFFSALPYLAMWLSIIMMGWIADYLCKKSYLTITTTRRLFNSIGMYGMMICLILVGYIGCSQVLTLSLLILSLGLNAAVSVGYMCSHLDIAPNYAGTLMGVTNSIATIPGFVAPAVVGYLINGQETLSQWRIVFWLGAVIVFIGNNFYIIFISGEEQRWNRLYVNDS